MWPGRQRANEHEDQDDKEDGRLTKDSAQPGTMEARLVEVCLPHPAGIGRCFRILSANTHAARNGLVTQAGESDHLPPITRQPLPP